MSASTAHRMDDALRSWYAARGVPPLDALDWNDYDALIAAFRSAEPPPRRHFTYEHPVRLQDADIGVGKPYPVQLAYCDSGGSGEPVIAVGGLTNVARRFDFLALDARPALRVISLDLAGRGRSGWLVELSDYHLDTYVEQIAQLMAHLGLDDCTMLGSSLGGSAVIRFAARNPGRVRRIVLNDSGPYIPAARRRRRAVSVGRHYVFHSPAEMFRRTGASEKHSGPAPDSVLLHAAHHKTRWSAEENGRVYTHDLRALLAYRAEAGNSLDLWEDWARVQCPGLLIHGLLSEAISLETIDRMRTRGQLSVIHVPETGHTSSLSDGPLIQDIAEWVADDRPFACDRTRAVAAWPKRVLYAHD